MNVLVVDIGGSHVKLALAGERQRASFDSSSESGPRDVFDRVAHETTTWPYDVVSIGYPGRVGSDGPTEEPGNLGGGWVGFDFERAVGKPVRIVNDAVLQALGAYEGGRMLFLSLATGLGSALVVNQVAVPLELGELPYDDRSTLMHSLGRDGLERLGHARWQEALLEVTPALRRAFLADYVILGGGNSARVETLPTHTRCGGNQDAVEGGYRLWRHVVEPHDRDPLPHWRVLA